MAVRRNPTGPLTTSTLWQIEETIFWGPTKPRNIPPRDDDREYMIKIGDQIDLIANKFYGDPQLWWVIVHRNDLRLIPNDLVPGRNIYIPTRDGLRRRGFVR